MPTPSEAERFAMMTLQELNASRPLNDVFFDYDSTTLRQDAREALVRNADWLRRWSSTAILIEGHADERGTAEYNLALGRQRAAVVESYLQALGVPADRIRTVSKGKEQPFCRERVESCWNENRRGHFVIVAK
jgi:peptidoglycan-associated lipoprotein